MTVIYKVSAAQQLHASDPLHVGRFYPYSQRLRREKMKDRQDLILYLAGIHSAAVKSGKPLGFCLIPMRLMSLREWVYDYKVVFEHFFDVHLQGYNLGDKHEISVVTPKRLEIDEVFGANHKRKLTYVVPRLPKDGVVSKVFVHQERKEGILEKLRNSGRFDLQAPVEWLLERPSREINFYFAPAGKLKQRDTSIWPISAIETWPAWLREDLFGAGIDIESAYTQFLVQRIREIYKSKPQFIELRFPDLIRSVEDKQQWRRELCCDLLGLEWDENGIACVKQLCMSLANGSRISPAILLGNSSYSMTRDIVMRKAPDLSPSNLIQIGSRLSQIGSQYASARKLVCNDEIGLQPSKKNQKLVFASYFEWERKARYAIWEKVERHGIMVHDGIDGIPEEYLTDIPALISSLNLRLTRS